MSNDHINWAKKQQISPTQKLLLLILADHSDIYGTCFPSSRLLSEETCLARGSIFRTMNELIELKLITKENQTRKNGSTTSNLYTLNVSILISKDGPREFIWGDARPLSTIPESPTETKGSHSETGRVSQRDGGGLTARYPEPSYEPSYKPINIPISDEIEKKQVLEKKPKKKLCEAPEKFTPNENNLSLAKELGLNIAQETQAFLDHHGSKGSQFKDWNLALNTWLRNAKKINANNTYQSKNQSFSSSHGASISNTGNKLGYTAWHKEYCYANGAIGWTKDQYDDPRRPEEWYRRRYQEYLRDLGYGALEKEIA